MIAEELAHHDSNIVTPDVTPLSIPTDSEPVDLENPVENPVPKENLKKKVIRRRISLKQKELMVNFIIENPELITHSSTKECERDLWNDLHQKLNDLKPEKSLNGWKKFFSKWKCELMTKPEASIMIIDYKLKKFLNKIITNDPQVPDSQVESVKSANSSKETVHDVLEKIVEVEKERSNLKLEIDDYELRIYKYKYLIHALENEIKLKQTRIRKLNNSKIYLNKRRRLLEKKDNCDIQPEIEEKIENEISEEQTEK